MSAEKIMQELCEAAGLESAGHQNIVIESKGKSFSSLIFNAQRAFLEDVKRGIKKVARSYAESIQVKGNGPVWLEYKGQNTDDFDLNFIMHVYQVSNNAHWAVLACKIHDVSGAEYSKEWRKPIGDMSVDFAVSVFERYF